MFIDSLIVTCLFFYRMFHASSSVLAQRRNEEAPGLRPKKQRRVKKENRTQPPVDVPYIPPRQNLTLKSSDKTVDIFEGITLCELAKRTGATVGALQDVAINVGEDVDSEFDPISIDVAELVAMVYLTSLHDIFIKMLH